MQQYVYSQLFEKCRTFPDASPANFALYHRPPLTLGFYTLLPANFGLFDSLITVLKIATPSRSFALITDNLGIASYCWISFGFCRHYPIEKHALMIGPVWTRPDARGRGLATSLLQNTIAELTRDIERNIYIDTSADNYGMQKVITRCGFGGPQYEYSR
jgi:GNAT superfamily N-acetyltransferase